MTTDGNGIASLEKHADDGKTGDITIKRTNQLQIGRW